ncbi:hypothetical protein [Bacillus rhizoplanae]|uniref:hypothetical protein n=1 Tax=Bacillus rhizoplanae TaxID=2880966 RepID=UPI003D1AE3F3
MKKAYFSIRIYKNALNPKYVEAIGHALFVLGFKEKLPPILYSLLPEKMVGLHHWTQ